MLVSRAIIFAITFGFPHGKGDIEIGKPAFTRSLANQHAETVFDMGLSNLTLHLGSDDMAVQAEIELAAGRDAQPPTDFHWYDYLSFIGNGNSQHVGSFSYMVRIL
jgi:hypothetical protein